MSILETELLASRDAAPSSPHPEALTLFPQPKRRNRPEPTPRHWRNEAERNAWLDAFDPNDDGQSPKGYREVSLDEL